MGHQTFEARSALLCVWTPKPLKVHSCRLVRKRCGICKMAMNIAARIRGHLAKQPPGPVPLACLPTTSAWDFRFFGI